MQDQRKTKALASLAERTFVRRMPFFVIKTIQKELGSPLCNDDDDCIKDVVEHDNV